MACGIFLDQGSNLCLLHWQADSLPLGHQGSPASSFVGTRRGKFKRLWVWQTVPASVVTGIRGWRVCSSRGCWRDTILRLSEAKDAIQDQAEHEPSREQMEGLSGVGSYLRLGRAGKHFLLALIHILLSPETNWNGEKNMLEKNNKLIPIQELNSGLPHCRQTLYPLSQGGDLIGKGTVLLSYTGLLSK